MSDRALGAVQATDMPLVMGTDADFEALRRWLTEIGFTEPAICERTGIASIHGFQMRRDGRTKGIGLDDALDVGIRLLLDSDVVPEPVVQRFIAAETLAVLVRLGVLRVEADGVAATVLLYPTEGMWCVSDQTEPPPGRPALSADVVYPAVTSNTKTFLEFLPRSPCDRLLEVCGGTGIAAMVGAHFAREVWTADVAERSARFAEFNGRLNGLANYTSVAGDMYAPVGEMLFDRIVAHPPYVPAEENSVIFRDGGQDGEQLVRRAIVEGVPRLAPGGLLYVTCVASDRKGARLEQRVREWLGPAGHDIDILLVARFDADPIEYRMRSLLKGKRPLTSLEFLARQVESLHIERSVYAHLYLRRRTDGAPGTTTRRRAGPNTGPAEIAWALAMDEAIHRPQALATVLEGRVRVNPRSALLVRYGLVDEGWVPAEVTQSTEWPFVSAVRGPFWLGDLLARCDGSTPLGATIAEFRTSGLMGAEATDEELGRLLLMLAQSGSLAIEGLPALPPAPVT